MLHTPQHGSLRATASRGSMGVGASGVVARRFVRVLHVRLVRVNVTYLTDLRDVVTGRGSGGGRGASPHGARCFGSCGKFHFCYKPWVSGFTSKEATAPCGLRPSGDMLLDHVFARARCYSKKKRDTAYRRPGLRETQTGEARARAGAGSRGTREWGDRPGRDSD